VELVRDRNRWVYGSHLCRFYGAEKGKYASLRPNKLWPMAKQISYTKDQIYSYEQTS